tara:strand:+ start:212 stop:502 length:291 start_codon:yes stop_codon:yes gene_type:complete
MEKSAPQQTLGERDSTTRFFTEQKARDANLANLVARRIHLDAFHSHSTPPSLRDAASPRARRRPERNIGNRFVALKLRVKISTTMMLRRKEKKRKQ